MEVIRAAYIARLYDVDIAPNDAADAVGTICAADDVVGAAGATNVILSPFKRMRPVIRVRVLSEELEKMAHQSLCGVYDH